MTVEPGQEGDPPRRKFDDVASLFGTIVPAPLAVPQLVKDYPLPLARREPPPPSPPPQAPIIQPPATVPAVQLATAPEPAGKPEPKPPPRQRPTELPWPDAFEPRPNYRRREPRNWSWLLLIPVGFVAAVGFTMLDPRTIRAWLDANVFHRISVAGSTEPPLLSTPPSTPAPSYPPPPPLAEAPILYPALPTSPVPVPPGTEVSPPPVDPAQAAAAAAVPIHITIQYRRNIPGSDGEARRMAALLQSFGGSIELHPNTATVKAATINYYNAADKTAATALATVLANEAATWIVRASPTKYPPGTLDVWLP